VDESVTFARIEPFDLCREPLSISKLTTGEAWLVAPLLFFKRETAGRGDRQLELHGFGKITGEDASVLDLDQNIAACRLRKR